MKTVLVINDLLNANTDGSNSIVDADGINSLGDGIIGVLTEAGAINALATLAASIPAITIHSGSTALKTPFGSTAIKRGTVAYTKAAYAAPVVKHMIVGEYYNGTGIISDSAWVLGTPVTGDSATIRVYDLENPNPMWVEPRYIKEHTIPIFTGDTKATIAARIVAIVNADAKSIVTASVHVDGSANAIGVKFAGKTAGENFGVTADGILSRMTLVEYGMVNRKASASTFVNSTAATGCSKLVYACGTAANVTKDVKEYYSHTFGVANHQNIADTTFIPPLPTIVTTGYVTYNLSYKSPKSDDKLGTKDGGYIKELTIYVSDAHETAQSASVTAFKALLDSL